MFEIHERDILCITSVLNDRLYPLALLCLLLVVDLRRGVAQRGLQCDDCSVVVYNATTSEYECINAIGDVHGPCEMNVKRGTDRTYDRVTMRDDCQSIKFDNKESVNAMDNAVDWRSVIDINEYLGDFTLLNTKYGILYAYVNESIHWLSDDEVIPPNIVLERFAYTEGTGEQISHLTMQCFVERFDIKDITKLNIMNLPLTLTPISDTMMNVKTDVSEFALNSFVLNLVCQKGTCDTQILGLDTEAFTKDLLLTNFTNIGYYTGTINSYVNEDFNFCRLAYVYERDISEQIQITHDTNVEILNYIGTHILKMQYTSLVEIYTRELIDSVNIAEIEDSLLRNQFDLSREVIELKRTMERRPPVKTVSELVDSFPILLKEKMGDCDVWASSRWKTRPVWTPMSFVTNEWMTRCDGSRATFAVNDGCHAATLPRDEACTNDNNDKFQKIINPTESTYVDSEIFTRINDEYSIYVVASYEQNYDGDPQLIMGGSGSANIISSTWLWILGYTKFVYAQGYRIKQAYLIFNNAINVPYNIDVRSRMYVSWTDKFSSDSRTVEGQFSEPAPAVLTLREKTYYGIKWNKFTSELNNLIGFSRTYDRLHYDFKYVTYTEGYSYTCGQAFRRYQMYNPRYELISGPSVSCYPGTPPITYYLYVDPEINSNDQIVYNIDVKLNSTLCNYESLGSTDPDVREFDVRYDDIVNQMSLFDQRLENVEEAIVDMTEFIEDVEAPSPWDIVDQAFGLLDLGDLVYSASKLISSVVRKSFSFIKSKITNALTVSKQWTERLKIKWNRRYESHITSNAVYSPLNAVEKGALYNYVGNYRLKQIENKVPIIETFAEYKNLFEGVTDKIKNDVIGLTQLNSGAYLRVQEMAFDRLLNFYNAFRLNNTDVPFGAVFVHTSPIDAIKPIGGKYLSERYGREVNNIFLSNRNVVYPFHTSFSSFNIETRDNDLLLVRRFGGISEASTVGPTNIKNPKVKIGLIRFEYKIDAKGSFRAVNWNETNKFMSEPYTETDVDNLFRSFLTANTYAKYKNLSTDDKWTYLLYTTEKKYAKRNIVDGVPIANPVYLRQLDRLFDYNTMYNNFNYNLLTRNCQSFVKSYIELATNGLSSGYIKDKNYENFIDYFTRDVEKYLRVSIDRGLVEKVREFGDKMYKIVSSFKINLL